MERTNDRIEEQRKKVSTTKAKSIKSINALQSFFTSMYWTTMKWVALICGCTMVAVITGGLVVELIDTLSSNGAHSFNGWWTLIVGGVVYALTIPLALFFEKSMINKMEVLMNAILAVADGDMNVKIDVSEEDDFKIVYEHFNNMVEEIKFGKNLRNEMANSFSHELKTPLASINGFARMLKNDDLPPEKKNQYLDMIISQSGRLSKLAQDTLTISKLDSMKIITDKRTYRLDEQIKNVCIAMENDWSNKDIELSVDCDEVEFYGNPDMIASIFTNLLGNAIKFTPKNGEIELKLRKEGTNAVFTITDTGIGMTEETKERIFDRFYQGDTSHSTKGSGLGLAIVKQLVDLFKGEITVDSKLDEGTTFTVTLPINTAKQSHLQQ